MTPSSVGMVDLSLYPKEIVCQLSIVWDLNTLVIPGTPGFPPLSEPQLKGGAEITCFPE